MTNTAKKPTISDDINALIRSKTETEKIDRLIQNEAGEWEAVVVPHTVVHPPLLEQLQQTVTTSTLNGDMFTGSAGSKPPSRLDAIALLQRIAKQSREIADTIRLRRTRDLTDRLSAISGAAPDQTQEDRTWIATLARGWVISARIITGWESPPFAPDVPCPNIDCERRGTLRIRLEDASGACIECGVHWTPETVTQLGTYVKWATDHLRGAKHWLTDEDGYPTECVDCLDTRVQMAARRAERRASAA